MECLLAGLIGWLVGTVVLILAAIGILIVITAPKLDT